MWSPTTGTATPRPSLDSFASLSRRRPAATPGRVEPRASAARRLIVQSETWSKPMTGEDEPDRAGSPLQQAEHRERRERPGLEVLHQEADGEIRGDPGRDASDQNLGPDPVAQGSEQFRELVHARRQDDRGGQ